MKLGSIPNLSLPPIITCMKGTLCAKKCYAMKSYRQYPAVAKNWKENLRFYQKDPSGYFNAVSTWLAKHKPEYFRWHVGGDIPDIVYLRIMDAVAKTHYNIQFLCYTKRWAMLQATHEEDVAPNLTLVLSRWPGDSVPANVGRWPQAWMFDSKNLDTRIPKAGTFICPGSCTDCKKCWELEGNESVVFHIH